LQTGLLQRVLVLADAVVVPVSVLTELPQPPKVQATPVTPAPAKPAQPSKPATPATPTAQTVAPPAAVPVATAPAEPAPLANAPSAAMQATAAAAIVASPAAAPTAPVTATAAKLELPSSSADYLHNPKPVYPKLSERRGEQGSVILHVLVGADGRVRELTVKSSSGFERLDQAAREAVLEWTFVPGKRNGAAVEMAVDVPIRFKPSE
jgi:protein TonB